MHYSFYTYSTLKNMFSKYRHCFLFYRHCGLDPQSLFVEMHNYASLRLHCCFVETPLMASLLVPQ